MRSRTSLVNHVRGTMKTFGVKLPSCSTRSFVAACADTLDDRDLTPVANVLANISNLNAEIAEMDRVIKRMCENDYPEAAKLQQIGGVGPISALGFVLTVEDPSRLRNGPRSAGAYFGLVPRKRRSGGSDAQLRITKAGDSFVRRLLVSCAQYIIGPFGPDTAMRRHGLRISERGGKNAKKRAVVAVARKLAVTMASVWESGQDYVDFPGGKPPGPTTGKPTNLGDCGATSA